MKFHAVVTAAGSGKRMGGTIRKQYLELGGIPVLARSLLLFLDQGVEQPVVAVIPPGDEGRVGAMLQPFCSPTSVLLVGGGDTRQHSVARGLSALPPEAELVCIHDGARPFCSISLLWKLLESAREHGAAIPVLPPGDTVKKIGENGRVRVTLSREGLRLAQTPQVFKKEIIDRAYAAAEKTGTLATDDSSLVEALGIPVRIVPGEEVNIKITTPHDLKLACLLSEEMEKR